MAYSSINEYEVRGTNNIEHCPKMLHVADATNNYVQYCIQNITSATPWVKLVGLHV